MVERRALTGGDLTLMRTHLVNRDSGPIAHWVVR